MEKTHNIKRGLVENKTRIVVALILAVCFSWIGAKVWFIPLSLRSIKSILYWVVVLPFVFQTPFLVGREKDDNIEDIVVDFFAILIIALLAVFASFSVCWIISALAGKEASFENLIVAGIIGSIVGTISNVYIFYIEAKIDDIKQINTTSFIFKSLWVLIFISTLLGLIFLLSQLEYPNKAMILSNENIDKIIDIFSPEYSLRS